MHISNSPSSNDSLHCGPLHTTMVISNQRHLNRASFVKVISTPQQFLTSHTSFSSPHHLSNQQSNSGGNILSDDYIVHHDQNIINEAYLRTYY